ncbi:MAG: class I SAM-dependent methyltransferase [bacterium]|nr:class I SAM-dependent methyltransferase [bacterium]
MNRCSEKPSGASESLALEDDIRERLGERRFRLIKLWVRDVNGVFDEAIARALPAEAAVLDAGCSRGDPDLPSVLNAHHPVGCDADMAGLRGNAFMRDRVQTVLDRMAFADESFDAVVCKFVVEHLVDPSAVFSEFARVLKPGGALVVLTPNRWSIFVVGSRLVPYWLKQVVKSRLFGGHEEDTFPTVYRANSATALNEVGNAAGLTTAETAYIPGLWAFFIFAAPLARLVRWLEYGLARVPLVGRSSTYIVFTCRKRGGEFAETG